MKKVISFLVFTLFVFSLKAQVDVKNALCNGKWWGLNYENVININDKVKFFPIDNNQPFLMVFSTEVFRFERSNNFIRHQKCLPTPEKMSWQLKEGVLNIYFNEIVNESKKVLYRKYKILEVTDSYLIVRLVE